MGHAAAKKKVNGIAGFYVDKIDGDVMRAFIKKNKIKLDTDDESTTEQVAVALTVHFRETTKPDSMCQCEECHGEAPDDTTACPFCGVEAEDEVEEEDEDEEDADIPDTGEDKKEELAAAPPKKAAAKKTTSKKEDKAMAKTSTALAKVEDKTLAKVSDKDLDAAVKRVIKLKTESTTSYYELCKEILDINKRGLWKLRKDEDGKVRYTNFEAFAYHELHMSGTNAFNMMGVAREYTDKDIAEIGHTKAVLILKAAPEDRKALAEAAKKGAPASEIRKGVSKSKKDRGYEGATEAAKRGSKGAKKKAETSASKASQDKITIAKIEGTKTIKLFAKPASLKNLDMDALKRAKTLANQPFGRLELANGVVMYISVFAKDDGLLYAKINTQREEPTAE